MSNSSELFPYTTISSSFKLIEPLFLGYRVHRHTYTHTDKHTDRHEYSIVEVDKPQLYLVTGCPPPLPLPHSWYIHGRLKTSWTAKTSLISMKRLERARNCCNFSLPNNLKIAPGRSVQAQTCSKHLTIL